MKKLCLFFAASLLAGQAMATITLNTVTAPSATAGTVTSLAITFTSAASGTNQIIVVHSVTGRGSATSITGVVWDGINFMNLTNTSGDLGQYGYNGIWYYYGPTQGVNSNITATANTASYINLGAEEFSGVDPFKTWGAISITANTGLFVSTTITTMYANSWVINGLSGYENSGLTMSANFTQMFKIGLSAQPWIAGGYLSTTAAGNYGAYSTDAGGANNAEQILAELVPLQPTATPTSSPTVTATYSFTSSPTPSPTSTFTASPTVTPTVTVSPTDTRSASPTSTLLPTSTFTPSPTVTVSPSVSPSVTFTASPTISPTFTASPTISPTFSISPTFTISQTFTVSPTISMTWTISPTFTVSPTITPTPSASPTCFSGWTPYPTPIPVTWTPGPSDFRNCFWCGAYPAYPTPTPVPTNSCAWCWP